MLAEITSVFCQGCEIVVLTRISLYIVECMYTDSYIKRIAFFLISRHFSYSSCWFSALRVLKLTKKSFHGLSKLVQMFSGNLESKKERLRHGARVQGSSVYGL